MVVRQLIRGNAIAHVVFVPWCDRKPRKGRPRGCVLTDVTKARPATRKGDRVGHQDDELPCLHPIDAARRQPRADPEVPEEHVENADDDLVALQCTARQERQRRGTITIGNPVHGAFEPNGYVNRSVKAQQETISYKDLPNGRPTRRLAPRPQAMELARRVMGKKPGLHCDCAGHK